MHASDEQPVVWNIGEVIDGKYRVLELLGEGTMGTVHRVRHLGWQVDLAVKSPRPEWFSSLEDIERFAREARTWVRLGMHPNVCACHYVRVLGNTPRLFAEYVPGGSLRERIDNDSLYAGDADAVVARILRISGQVARGLEHAHSQGVVHQDVKPANVLLDGEDETDETAKIADFGLAQARTVAMRGFAASGTNMAASDGGMTLEYAAPEQLKPKGTPVGQRSDIYSLGVSILEMFNGRVTWPAGPVAGAMLGVILSSGASRPGVPPIPRELASLLERCLRDAPEARPETMTEVAQEIEALYRAMVPGSPPTEPSAAELRAIEHNNRALSLIDLEEPEDAETELLAALHADPQHLDTVYNAGLLAWRRGEITDDELLTRIRVADEHGIDPSQTRRLLVQVHLERGDKESARKILDRERPDDLEIEEANRALESTRVGHTGELRATPVLQRFKNAIGAMSPILFSSDGGCVVSTDSSGGVQLWAVDSGELLSACPGAGGLGAWDIDVCADGSLAVTVSRTESVVRVWNFHTKECVHEFRPDRPDREFWINSLRLSPDGCHVIVVTEDGELITWDVSSGIEQKRLGGLSGFMGLGLHMNADGSQLIAVIDSNKDKGRHPNNGRHPKNYRIAHIDLVEERVLLLGDSLGEWPRSLAVTANLRTAVTAGDKNRGIQVWNLRSGECTKRIPRPADGFQMAVDDSARLALASGPSYSIQLWDLAEGRCLRTFQGHTARVGALWISPDGSFGRSVDADGVIRSWSWQVPIGYRAPLQLSRPQRVAEVAEMGSEVRRLVSQAERAMATSRYADAYQLLVRARSMPGHERDSKVLRAWRELGQHMPAVGLRASWAAKTISGQKSFLFSLDISADARLGVSGHLGSMCLWDMDKGSMIREFHTDLVVEAIGLSRDGQEVVCGEPLGAAQLWSAATGERLLSGRVPAEGNTSAPRNVMGKLAVRGAISGSTSANGRRVLFGFDDGTLGYWDMSDASLHMLPDGHPGEIRVTWIGADGQVGASLTRESVRIWDLALNECQREIFLPHSSRPASVCASSDGTSMIVAWDSPPGMQLWNSAGECVRTFDDLPSEPAVTRFSSDGRFIFAGHGDGSITVWSTMDGSCQARLDRHPAAISDIRLTPDGRYALSGSGDGTLVLWELDWELGPLLSHSSQAPRSKTGQRTFWQNVDLIAPAGPSENGGRDLENELLDEFVYSARRGLRRSLGVPRKPDFFVGRHDTLERLEVLLTPGTATAPVVLHGPGGVGKTAIAGYFAATFSERFDEVIWLDASSWCEVQCGLSALGAALRPASGSMLTEPALADWAAAQLAERSRLLLVLDDVADPRYVQNLLDTASGAILITSRNVTAWDGGVNLLAVDVLGGAEAEDLLVRCAERHAQPGVAELCERLGFLPLTIELAAAYLRQSSCTPQDYLALIDTEPSGTIGWQSGLRMAEQVVTRACGISLHRHGADQLPGNLLEVLGWFAPEQIPAALFLGEPNDPDLPSLDHLGSPARKAQAIAALEAYRLIRVHRSADGQTMIAVHRMIQDAVRILGRNDSQRSDTAGRTFATVALHQGLPQDARDRSNWPAFRALLPHISELAANSNDDQDRLLYVNLFNRTAQFLMDQGQHTAAIDYLERVAAGCLTELGPKHPNTLISMSTLATAYLEAGDRVLGVRILSNIAEDFIEVLGIHHPATIAALNSLGSGYSDTGDLPAAVQVLKLTVEASSQANGADHPDTLLIRTTLARAYQDSGDAQRAISALEEVLETSTRALGRNHSLTIEVARTTAEAYMAAEQYVKAADLYERFFRDCVLVFGMDHPQTLSAGTGLGEAYQALGIPEWRVSLLEKTLQICEQSLGNGDPQTLLVADQLARLRDTPMQPPAEVADPETEIPLNDSRNGDRAHSVEFLEESLADFSRRFGAGHPQTLTVAQALASIYRRLGNPESELRILEQIAHALRQELGPAHQRTLLARLESVRAQRDSGHLSAAVSAGEQILSECERALGREHEASLAAVNALAATLLAADDLARATDLYSRALSDSLKIFGNADPRTYTAIHNIADCYRRAGDDLPNAIQLLERVRTARIRVLGPDHPDVLVSTDTLALAYLADGNAARAVPLFRQAHTDRVRLLGSEHPQTLMAAVDLVHAFTENRMPSESRLLGTRVLAACERILGADHLSTQRLRADLERVHPG